MGEPKGLRIVGPRDAEPTEAEAPRRGAKPAVKAGAKAAPRPRGPSIWQRLLRRSPEITDKLPHSTFSDTSMGVRSVVKAGHGSPTVIFEAGLGHDKRTWGRVFNVVSEVTRAVAYDRAGYGQSEAAEGTRDGLQVVLELRALLETEGIEPPYVLVGHSLGGTFMKLFAKMYPAEVSGVVLVDARHEEFAQRCEQVGVPRLMYEPPEALLRRLSAPARAELAAARLTMKQARRAGRFPPVPLIVLTHHRATSKWPERIGQVWAASQQRLAEMSRLGKLKVAEYAGHNVHIDRPELVTRAVLNVVRAARYVQARKKDAARETARPSA